MNLVVIAVYTCRESCALWQEHVELKHKGFNLSKGCKLTNNKLLLPLLEADVHSFLDAGPSKSLSMFLDDLLVRNKIFINQFASALFSLFLFSSSLGGGGCLEVSF